MRISKYDILEMALGILGGMLFPFAIVYIRSGEYGTAMLFWLALLGTLILGSAVAKRKRA